MPTRQPEQSDPHAMILGEMRGQLREMVHSVNNLSTKFEGLTREVIGLGAMASDIGELKARVRALETEKSERDGERGAWGWIIDHSPWATLAALGAAIAAWWRPHL